MARNDVLKWFNKHYLRKNIILPKNTMKGYNFVNSINIKHLIYLKIKVLKYEDEKYYLHHYSIFDVIKELLSNNDILKHCQ